jgi:hypothetical protein
LATETTIKQTNRSILFDGINPAIPSLFTYLSDTEDNMEALDDKKIKEINDALLVHSFDEFLDKFKPVIYGYFDTNNEPFHSTTKPVGVADMFISKYYLDRKNSFMKMLISMMDQRKTAGGTNITFNFEAIIKDLAPEKILKDMQVLKNEIRYFEDKNAALESDNPAKQASLEKLERKYEETVDFFNETASQVKLATAMLKENLTALAEAGKKGRIPAPPAITVFEGRELKSITPSPEFLYALNAADGDAQIVNKSIKALQASEFDAALASKVYEALTQAGSNIINATNKLNEVNRNISDAIKVIEIIKNYRVEKAKDQAKADPKYANINSEIEALADAYKNDAKEINRLLKLMGGSIEPIVNALETTENNSENALKILNTHTSVKEASSEFEGVYYAENIFEVLSITGWESKKAIKALKALEILNLVGDQRKKALDIIEQFEAESGGDIDTTHKALTAFTAYAALSAREKVLALVDADVTEDLKLLSAKTDEANKGTVGGDYMNSFMSGIVSETEEEARINAEAGEIHLEESVGDTARKIAQEKIEQINEKIFQAIGIKQGDDEELEEYKKRKDAIINELDSIELGPESSKEKFDKKLKVLEQHSTRAKSNKIRAISDYKTRTINTIERYYDEAMEKHYVGVGEQYDKAKGEFQRSLILSAFTDRANLAMSAMEPMEKVQRYNYLSGINLKWEKSFILAAKNLIQKLLSVKAFFDQYDSKITKMKPSLLVVNADMNDIEGKDLERLELYLKSVNDKLDYKDSIWFAIAPQVRFNPEIKGDREDYELKMREMGYTGDFLEPGAVNEVSSLTSVVDITSRYRIQTFFSYETCEDTTFSAFATKGVEAYVEKTQEFADANENAKYIIPALPNFSVIPRDAGKVVYGEEAKITDGGTVKFSSHTDEQFRYWIQGVYVSAAHVACGLASACQCPEYLKNKATKDVRYSVLDNSPGVRFDIESGNYSEVIKTTMPREDSGITSNTRRLLAQSNFGFIFSSDKAGNVAVRSARCMEKSDGKYVSIFKEITKSYIVRIMEEISEGKSDLIQAQFAPGGQIKQWELTKGGYANSILYKDDLMTPPEKGSGSIRIKFGDLVDVAEVTIEEETPNN